MTPSVTAAQKPTAEAQKNGAALAWERIRNLREVVTAHGGEGDVLRHLPDPIVKAFVEADLYRVLVPQDLGGLGLDPLTTFDLGVELSSYDGSVGWNFGIGASAPTLIGSLPVARLKTLFNTADCGVAASGVPPGKAQAVDGGYLLTGRWTFASGIQQAKWVAAAGIVMEGDKPRLGANGKPMVKFCIMHKEQVEVLDTWVTGGMRGTGSTDFRVSDLFVPEADTCVTNAPTIEHPAAIFRLPSTYFGMMFCAVAVGIAKGTVGAFKQFVLQDRSGLRDQGYVQYAVARAEALYEAGHLNVVESFRPMWETIVSRASPTLEQRARVRRSYVHAVESAIEAVTLCYNAAGGAAIQEAHPFHRALRDVYAVNAHKTLSRRFMELSGQAALGGVDTASNPLF